MSKYFCSHYIYILIQFFISKTIWRRLELLLIIPTSIPLNKVCKNLTSSRKIHYNSRISLRMPFLQPHAIEA